MRDDLVTPLRVVCVADDAVDWTKTPIDRYVAERDPDLVVALPGRAPVWFSLRPLTAGMFVSSVESLPNMEARWMRSFQLACERIDGLEPSGKTIFPTFEQKDEMNRSFKMIDEFQLNDLMRAVGIRWIYEIGRVAYQRADEGNARSGGVHYTLPPTSVPALNQITRRLAGQIRDESATSSSASPA